MEHVRTAEVADARVVEELLGRAAAERDGARGAALLQRLGDAVSTGGAWPDGVDASWLGPHAGRIVLCGEFAGVVVGVAAGEIGQRTEVRVGRVLGCYVEPEARGVGVGAALLAGLMAFFDEAGCSDVDATALPGERATKQLLEGAGFKARLVVLHRALR